MAHTNSKGRELQLLKKVDDSLELDHDVLFSVLTHPSIGDRPISVVSIAGAFRTGKSFMLNFFLRYFKNRGYENSHWMGNSSKSLKDGIQWRRGLTANTCGINIWSKPFIVTVGRKEIAVILLDTQGNSDHADSRQSDVKVFVISALLSSTLVYNISERINNSDLEYLQFFAEHAKARKNIEDTQTSFQNLWFLVRDWCYPLKYSYGLLGGMDYQRSVLESNDESSLKKYICEAFKRVNCFLMPDPGRAVRRPDNEDSLTLGDIDVEFFEHIPRLTDCLLNPESLVVKRIKGEIVSGRWLAEYIVQCWGQLKNGGLLKSETMMEMEAKTRCQEYKDRAIATWKEDIKKKHTSYVNDYGIKLIHQEAKDTALKFYNENAKYGGEIVEEHRKKLERCIDYQLLDSLLIKNALFKHETELMLRKAVVQCKEEYVMQLKQYTRESWKDREGLEKIHYLHLAEARKSFYKKSHSIRCAEMMETSRKKLVEEINDQYSKFESLNKSYEENAEKCYRRTLSEAIDEYKNCLKEVLKTSGVSDDVFKNAHEKGKMKAQNQLGECDSIPCPRILRERYQKKLLCEIERNEELFRHKNHNLKERSQGDQLTRRGIDRMWRIGSTESSYESFEFRQISTTGSRAAIFYRHLLYRRFEPE